MTSVSSSHHSQLEFPINPLANSRRRRVSPQHATVPARPISCPFDVLLVVRVLQSAKQSILHISWWRIVTSSNHRSFTKLIHDDVELGINGVAHREEELTRFDRWFWRRS
ncbi:hypothetical protein DY000_02023191 [Brassica cretica]|uniref:Uncharacterized protein n=1 Tax=Brassica cretica TaxID=69181 RepID=A0ABQ7E574_BRACR|nr:hypothetical protein DY000_02023191 [Brassica cretica]